MNRYRSLEFAEVDGSLTPLDLLQALPGQSRTCLLESTGHTSTLGRHSFFCTNPIYAFKSKRKRCWAGPPDAMVELPGTPLAELGELLRKFRFPQAWSIGLPPFLGGAVGYFGYEMLYLIEDIHDLGRDDLPVPDCQLLFFDTVVAFDHQVGKAWTIANGFGETKDDAKRAAVKRHQELVERVDGVTCGVPSMTTLRRKRADKFATRPQLDEASLAAARVTPVMSHADYVDVVRRAKEEIFSGNVFEICTSQRYDTTFDGSALDLYDILRGINYAPFGSFLTFDDVEVVSSSPERFLRLDRERWVETRPMKGTRPRGRTVDEDEKLVVDLATDDKSAAENMMIVDLARNDLGRVCQFNTVDVPELRVIETYPYTHQLVSSVRGRLEDGVDIVELLRATFPGGSMTGAPKVEALKIIDRLEPVKRGIWSGSIGYIDFDGAMDLNIVIRSMIKKGKDISFHVGGAIVADSDPEEEYQETLDKAHGLVVALELARERRERRDG